MFRYARVLHWMVKEDARRELDTSGGWVASSARTIIQDDMPAMITASASRSAWIGHGRSDFSAVPTTSRSPQLSIV